VVRLSGGGVSVAAKEAAGHARARDRDGAGALEAGDQVQQQLQGDVLVGGGQVGELLTRSPIPVGELVDQRATADRQPYVALRLVLSRSTSRFWRRTATASETVGWVTSSSAARAPIRRRAGGSVSSRSRI
jgi:hypothetical protein